MTKEEVMEFRAETLAQVYLELSQLLPEVKTGRDLKNETRILELEKMVVRKDRDISDLRYQIEMLGGMV